MGELECLFSVLSPHPLPVGGQKATPSSLNHHPFAYLLQLILIYKQFPSLSLFIIHVLYCIHIFQFT